MSLSSSKEEKEIKKGEEKRKEGRKGKRRRARKEANFIRDQTTQWEVCQIKEVSKSLTFSSTKRLPPPLNLEPASTLNNQDGRSAAPAAVGLFFKRTGSFPFLPLGALRCHERSPSSSAGDRGHVEQHWVPEMRVKKPSWLSQSCRTCRWFQIQLFSECNPTRGDKEEFFSSVYSTHRTERDNDKWLLKPLNFRVVCHTTIDKQNKAYCGERNDIVSKGNKKWRRRLTLPKHSIKVR